MNTANSESDAMVLDFIETSKEALDDVESDIIQLEKDAGNSDVLNEIFRSVHSIKGTAGFLAFDKVVTLAHASEELLNKLRKGEREVDSDVIDVVLRANDGLRDLISSIAEAGVESEDILIDETVAVINEYL